MKVSLFQVSVELEWSQWPVRGQRTSLSTVTSLFSGPTLQSGEWGEEGGFLSVTIISCLVGPELTASPPKWGQTRGRATVPAHFPGLSQGNLSLVAADCPCPATTWRTWRSSTQQWRISTAPCPASSSLPAKTRCPPCTTCLGWRPPLPASPWTTCVLSLATSRPPWPLSSLTRCWSTALATPFPWRPELRPLLASLSLPAGPQPSLPTRCPPSLLRGRPRVSEISAGHQISIFQPRITPYTPDLG